MRSIADSHSIVARAFTVLIVLTCVLPVAGCRMCCDTEDEFYAAYGGSWERTRRESGRVGSVLDQAGAKASSLVSRDEPEKPDALERSRRKDDPSGAATDPSQDPDRPRTEDESTDGEEAMRQRRERLREQGLEDIKIVPGTQVPPSVY